MSPTMTSDQDVVLDAVGVAGIDLLGKDLREAGESLWPNEARFLVDLYYQVQEHRLRAQGQVRSLTESGEPTAVLHAFMDAHYDLEKRIGKVLDYWTASIPLGRWARSNKGVGPVLAAGLIAHIDIERAQTAGSIWRYAGLDPTSEWGKGEKRPWNPHLKTLCWKIGESFTKVSGYDDAFYGQIYKDRKVLEVERNERGDFADQAAASLERKNYGKTTDAYKAYVQGKLPKARIQLRAQRYAVKLFLAHFHHVAYELRYNKPPPKPYVVEHLGHAHIIGPPNWPLA